MAILRRIFDVSHKLLELNEMPTRDEWIALAGAAVYMAGDGDKVRTDVR